MCQLTRDGGNAGKAGAIANAADIDKSKFALLLN